LPSIFERRLALYKEWHDFVFFDREKGIFGLLNFAIYGNPYDVKRGYGGALVFFVDSQGTAVTKMKLISLDKLHVTSFSPDFLSDDVTVSYQKNHSFKTKGKLDSVSFDLDFQVVLPPTTSREIVLDILSKHRLNTGMIQAAAEMSRLWDCWVELPRLNVSGEVALNGVTDSINTRTGYQDHEGGIFDWGSTWGWDTGVLLCDPSVGREPGKVSFLFYRFGPTDNLSHGGIVMEIENSKQKYFDSERINISRTGNYSGDQKFCPGITRLLYPDYRPYIPRRITFSGFNNSDKVKIVFTPMAVCNIVLSGIYSNAETIFHEMFCNAALSCLVDGQIYDGNIPCWFESVRPRGTVKKYALKA